MYNTLSYECEIKKIKTFTSLLFQYEKVNLLLYYFDGKKFNWLDYWYLVAGNPKHHTNDSQYRENL